MTNEERAELYRQYEEIKEKLGISEDGSNKPRYERQWGEWMPQGANHYIRFRRR